MLLTKTSLFLNKANNDAQALHKFELLSRKSNVSEKNRDMKCQISKEKIMEKKLLYQMFEPKQ